MSIASDDGVDLFEGGYIALMRFRIYVSRYMNWQQFTIMTKNPINYTSQDRINCFKRWCTHLREYHVKRAGDPGNVDGHVHLWTEEKLVEICKGAIAFFFHSDCDGVWSKEECRHIQRFLEYCKTQPEPAEEKEVALPPIQRNKKAQQEHDDFARRVAEIRAVFGKPPTEKEQFKTFCAGIEYCVEQEIGAVFH